MTEQTQSLFDSRGIFMALDVAVVATMDAPLAAAYLAVRDSAAVLAAADAAFQAAQDRVAACAEQSKGTERYLNDMFPKPSFHDLWRQTRRGAN